jgi:ceramide glucosyltransferase
MSVLSVVCGVLVVAGCAQAFAGTWAVRRFRAAPAPVSGARPAITVLKPLHGDEPLLEAALASVCAQDYPRFQVVFGVQTPADPALGVVDRLRHRFPACDIAVVVDSAAHGMNRKVGNLMNMLAAARHDVLVIGDSDVHCEADFLARVADTLAQPGTGLVTTLYTGVPGAGVLTGRLGASWISHTFLPGAMLARMLGRQDCLGATMALRRDTLAAIGGFAALVDHLADDHRLGRLVRQAGLAVRLAPTVPATTVPETELAALLRHELRWARTLRALVPLPFALSAVQFPLFWAGLAMLLSAGAGWTWILFLLAWGARAAAAWAIDDALGLTQPARAPVWLLPLRDWLSVGVMLASYGGNRVEWRGQVLLAGRPGWGGAPGPGQAGAWHALPGATGPVG